MRKCANCEYYDGSCKRFPPTVKNIGHNTLTRHPVDSEDWCGEFSRKNIPVLATEVTKQTTEKSKLLGNKRK